MEGRECVLGGGGVKHKRRPMKKSTFLECTFVMGLRFLRFVTLSVDLVSF